MNFIILIFNKCVKISSKNVNYAQFKMMCKIKPKAMGLSNFDPCSTPWALSKLGPCKVMTLLEIRARMRL
jgi:hypothetical protein